MQWRGLLVAAGLGAVVAYLWCSRPNTAHDELIAHSDSLEAEVLASQLRIDSLLIEIDSTREQTGRSAASGAAEHARSTTISRQPIRPPSGTIRDSSRFWSDSASKAQRAYTSLESSVGYYRDAYEKSDAQLLVARDSIKGLNDSRTDLLNENNKLAAALRSTRSSCSTFCPGIVAGVGYTVTGDLTAFVGVGVRIDPVRALGKVIGL